MIKEAKTCSRNSTGTTWMNMKMFNGNDLPHKLLLTAIQKTMLRNVFNNIMSTDIKLSKGQLSKIIQSGGFLDHYYVN